MMIRSIGKNGDFGGNSRIRILVKIGCIYILIDRQNIWNFSLIHCLKLLK